MRTAYRTDMSNTYIQVRTNQNDKEQASAILDKLGTNISTVVNMLLKQIIMTKGIPFEIKMNSPYNEDEEIIEINATMAMEDLALDRDDVKLVREYQNSSADQQENIRKRLISELQES